VSQAGGQEARRPSSPRAVESIPTLTEDDMLHAISFHLRASDDDRERTVTFLNDQCARGRLSVEELSSRVERAYRAVELGTLDALTQDLPGSPLSPAAPAPRTGLARRPLHVGLGLGLVALAVLTVIAIVPAEVSVPLLLLALPLGGAMLFAVAPIAVPLLLVAWTLHVLSPRR